MYYSHTHHVYYIRTGERGGRSVVLLFLYSSVVQYFSSIIPATLANLPKNHPLVFLPPPFSSCFFLLLLIMIACKAYSLWWSSVSAIIDMEDPLKRPSKPFHFLLRPGVETLIRSFCMYTLGYVPPFRSRNIWKTTMEGAHPSPPRDRCCKLKYSSSRIRSLGCLLLM